MSDASTKQAVECPICGDEFDPTVAGGWCTNTECGEWQYTEGNNESDAATETESSDDGFVSQDTEEDTDSVDLFSDSAEDEAAQADDSEVDDVGADLDLGAEESDEPDADDADDAGADLDADEPELEDDADDADDAEVDLDLGTEEPDEPELEDETDDAGADLDVDESDEATDAVEEPDVDDADDAGADLDADESDAAETDDDADEAVIDCPDCGAELDAEANFCVECGADVSDVPGDDGGLDECPGCGASVEDEDNFCVNCGEDLEAHRESDTDESHDDAIEALEADDTGEVPESLVLEVEGHEISVDDGNTVGREIRAALTDAGRPDDEAVRIHREHVRFVRESDSFYLLDLGDNPTQLNGRTLQKGDREPVAPGDELELSGVASVSVRLP